MIEIKYIHENSLNIFSPKKTIGKTNERVFKYPNYIREDFTLVKPSFYNDNMNKESNKI